MSTSYEMNRTLLYLRLRLLLACTLQREEVDAVELNVSRSPQTLTHSPAPMAAGQAWGEVQVATLPNHQVGQEQLLRAARCLKRQQSTH